MKRPFRLAEHLDRRIAAEEKEFVDPIKEYIFYADCLQSERNQSLALLFYSFYRLVVKKHVMLVKEIEELESSMRSKQSTLSGLQASSDQVRNKIHMLSVFISIASLLISSAKSMMQMLKFRPSPRRPPTPKPPQSLIHCSCFAWLTLRRAHTIETMANLKKFHLQKVADLKHAFTQYARAQVV